MSFLSTQFLMTFPLSGKLDISWKSWIVFLLFLAGVSWYLFQPAKTVLPPKVHSQKNLALIGNALSRFYDSSNQLPTALQDLIPEFIREEQIEVFFPTWDSRYKNKALRTDIIDSEGAYVYLGREGLEINILAHEKPFLWSGSFFTNEIGTITTNFEYKVQNFDTLKKLIKMETQK